MRAIALVLLLFPAPVLSQPAEPAGYRMEEYRAPVPDTLAGATVLDTHAARALWEGRDVAFIDVLPRAPKPANLPDGTIWRDRPRLSIPGAIWLPNTGYGEIAAVTEAYLRDGLAQASGGAKDHPLVIFCLADCWMSWNVAKRAMEMGYTDVSWMPEGTDGWAAAGYDLEAVRPMPGHP